MGTTRLTSREFNHHVSCEALAVAARNTQDFEEAGVVLDPWSVTFDTHRK